MVVSCSLAGYTTLELFVAGSDSKPYVGVGGVPSSEDCWFSRELEMSSAFRFRDFIVSFDCSSSLVCSRICEIEHFGTDLASGTGAVNEEVAGIAVNVDVEGNGPP